MRELSDIVVDINLAEASAWLVRMEGQTPPAAVEDAFKVWLAESPSHARAYAKVADTWEIIPSAVRCNSARLDTHSSSRNPRGRKLSVAVAASVAIILMVVGFGSLDLRNQVYQTSTGEMKVVTLSDGTRVTLDADTRLRVDYGKNERRIRLERGQAMFDDVEDSQRPFIVQANGYQVRALGTIFDVHSASKHLAVTLLDGRVDVSQEKLANSQTAPTPISLSPGERLVIGADGAAAIDHPSLAAISAWQRWQLVLNDVPLGNAITQINRYGGTPIRVADPALAQMRVSGVFPIRDPAAFANAVANLHHLGVARSSKGIVITR